MKKPDPFKRRTFLQLASLLALDSPLMALAKSSNLSGDSDAGSPNETRFGDARITFDFDDKLRSSVSCVVDGQRTRMTRTQVSDFLCLSDGSQVDGFRRTHAVIHVIDGLHGNGQSLLLQGVAKEGLEKTVKIRLFDRYPGFAFYSVSYRNVGNTEISIRSWTNCAHTVNRKGTKSPAFWSYSGGSYSDRRDWLQPVDAGFEQRNFMGMTSSDYGGGTPVVDVWRRDCGIAVGHLELTPKNISLPVRAVKNSVQISVVDESGQVLKPGEQLDTWDTFVAVHTGDYFAVLDTYRKVMADAGIRSPVAPKTSYEPIWCAWGYERDFSMAYVEGTLGKAKELGLEWAVIDDGWQTANGDWYVDTKKFPRGETDLKELVVKIRNAGLKPRLWYTPLAVGPGTDLLHDHTDMLLLDKDGAVQNITWWNSFYLCPAYPPTIAYTKLLVKKMLGEWGFAGLKIDGQHLNGVAPCFNPAHHHQRPEESTERLQDFFKAIYDTAMEINPEAVVEICPCGTSYAFHNMPYMNQAPASDPLSSWQVRLKGKTLKALMGPSAPFAGDHVELSDGQNDFASTVGIGAVVSTKFTWPIDPKLKDSFLLTPEHEVLWRKWISIYKARMLPTGYYRGELYDIGFDKPETHVVEKDRRIYFAFYAKTWNGEVELRGLDNGTYAVRDYVNDIDLGQVTAGKNRLHVAFAHSLLIETIPL